MQVLKPIRLLAALAVLVAATGTSHGQIFEDRDFMASGYDTSQPFQDSGTVYPVGTEPQADFRFNIDYSSIDVFNDGFITVTIPEAPNTQVGTDTATTGVFLSANNDNQDLVTREQASFAAIMPNALNIGQGTANENFKMSVDVFNSAGTGIGGTAQGTTNYSLVGIHQTNTDVQVNELNSPGGGSNLTGQGLRLGVTGDSGAAEDYMPVYGGAYYRDRPLYTGGSDPDTTTDNGFIDSIAGERYFGNPNEYVDFTTVPGHGQSGLVTQKVNDFWVGTGDFELYLGDPEDVNTPDDPTKANLDIFTGDSLHSSPDPVDPPNANLSFFADSITQVTGPVTHYTAGVGPIDDYETNVQAGVPGNRWSEHDLYWVDGVFTYVIDGTPVLQIDPEHGSPTENIYDPFSDSGSVLLGFWDRFSSVALSPEGANFIIYDNLVIETATAGDVPDVDALVDSLTLAPVDGDLDGDGDVDVSDALAAQRAGTSLGVGSDWDTNFKTGALTASATNTVPEPTSAVLMLAAFAGLALRRRG